MSKYVGRKVQTSTALVYSPDQSCWCGSCSIGTAQLACNTTQNNVTDWVIGKEDCCGGFCPQRFKCAAVDKNECFVGLNSSGKDPLIRAEWDGRAPNLLCEYNVADMNSLNVIERYRGLFGRTDDYNEMMQNLCIQESTECTVDPITGKFLERCSNLKARNATGDACRIWFEKQSIAVKDAIVKSYCSKFPKNQDCLCINRLASDQYKKLKPNAPYNDGCWYTPCATNTYLKESDVINPTCPTNFCQIVFDNLNNNNVNIDDNKNIINCEFSPGPGPRPPPPPPPPPPQPEPKTNFTPYIVGGIIFFVIVIIILVVATRRQSSSSINYSGLYQE